MTIIIDRFVFCLSQEQWRRGKKTQKWWLCVIVFMFKRSENKRMQRGQWSQIIIVFYFSQERQRPGKKTWRWLLCAIIFVFQRNKNRRRRWRQRWLQFVIVFCFSQEWWRPKKNNTKMTTLYCHFRVQEQQE
jgi:hypothetical protein